VQQATVTIARHPDVPIDPAFVRRWSPRSFRSDPVPRAVLDAMVEASRWAPSSFNEQPWRFHVSAGQDTTREAWNAAVLPFNRAWSDRAPVLAFVTARRTFSSKAVPPGTVNRHAWFDTGAAAIQYVLEGERHGVKSHYLGGIDAAKAHEILGLEEDCEVVAAIVSGYPGDAAGLPEALRGRETPSGRKPASEVAVFA
jgi:nitroreductase